MNSKQTLMASVLAGIGASLCCVAPLVLLSLGIGGAWVANLAAFEPMRPVFTGLALLFIGLSFRKLYLTPRTCEPGKPCADDVSIRTRPHPSGETRRRIEVGGLFLPVNEEVTVKDNDTNVSLSTFKNPPEGGGFRPARKFDEVIRKQRFIFWGVTLPLLGLLAFPWFAPLFY